MTDFTVERHGKGWAIYRGRDVQHHGYNLGQLVEADDELAQMIEQGLNASEEIARLRAVNKLMEGALATTKTALIELQRMLEEMQK